MKGTQFLGQFSDNQLVKKDSDKQSYCNEERWRWGRDVFNSQEIHKTCEIVCVRSEIPTQDFPIT
jgi:hypothetical protein